MVLLFSLFCPALFFQLFINNEWLASESGKKMAVINPSTGEKISEVDEGDKIDIDKAVKAAVNAFKGEWSQKDASTRGLMINNLANAIERDIDYIAKLESLDNGKPITAAKGDIEHAVGVFRYYAGLADKVHGKTIPADGNVFSLTLLEPVGVCGQIIPWNYPVAMLSWKWAPALAAGCTLVLKPSEKTPLSALYIASLAKETGFPPGVVNVVNGYGPTAGTALVSHPDVAKIAFTGSTKTGQLIQTLASNSNKRVSLELGGKSPLIICNDADIEKAAQLAQEGCMVNSGQCCCAATRTFVQEDIYEQFIHKSKELALKRVLGSPHEPDVVQGPQIDQIQFDKILSYIKTGKKEGARLITGGCKADRPGYFIEPTIFADVTDNMTIAKEEIFGPVQSILKFKTLDEAIERANNTDYGLGAGIFTKDITTALNTAKKLKAGSVWINVYDYATPQTPFGGFKRSGFGRELGEDGITEYLEVKTVTISLD